MDGEGAEFGVQKRVTATSGAVKSTEILMIFKRNGTLDRQID